ncbi:hypothetical protein Tco_0155208 [Tanacetum coccineum]
MATKHKLDADLSGKLVDQTDYRSKIGSLMYLTSSRQDIVGTINIGLWYPKDSGFELIAFSDADHAGYLDTSKSTSRGIQILDNSSETKLWRRLLESFQEDLKYDHVGQDTRSQGGKDDQDKQAKDLEILESKAKSKDNDKG